MGDFTFTRVSIIQALKPTEFHSGTELKGYIDGLREDNPAVPVVDLILVASKNEFMNTLHGLTADCAQLGEQPILHIEAHGMDNLCGLVFPDGSNLDWFDIAGPLAKLNEVTGFNMIVCVAACFGGHFIEGLKPEQPSPCFALIGPTHKTDGAELLRSFRGLYRELLVNLDMNAALRALHTHRLDKGGFLTITAEEWFFKLTAKYLKEGCSREILEKRANYIRADLEEEGTAMPMATILQLGQELARGFLNRRFETFFMTSEIPHNTERFAESFAKAKKSADDFFASQGF
jgi:hypothetical protein